MPTLRKNRRLFCSDERRRGSTGTGDVYKRQAQDALDRRIEEIRANADEGDPGYDITAGTVVIQDVKTGEILTMASSPGYDLSTYLENYAQLAADERNPLWNRATNGTYAPGSTFKPCVTLAALALSLIHIWYAKKQ